MEANEKKLGQFNYGLIVIDPTQEGDDFNILHFCGYWEKPNEKDAEFLMEELKTDPEFGLTDIADRLEILPAPDYIVEEYRKIYSEIN